jgi:restriction endonuclease Mrr
MVSKNTANEFIDGLIAGDKDALNEVSSRAWRILIREWRLKRVITNREQDDILSAALVDLLTAIQRGRACNDSDLQRIIRRTVVREARKAYQLNIRDHRGVEKAETRPRRMQSLRDVPFVELEDKHHVHELELFYKENKSEEAKAYSEIDLLVVDDELIRFFSKHPQKMYQLEPRKFEELVAAILKDLGYSIELTAHSADGGVDIFATQKSKIGEVLLIVDCKRYAAVNHVGVEIVRALYGICEQLRASMAMVATTSFFTRPAQEFQRTASHRLSLKDYNDLVSWLADYKPSNTLKT